MRTVPREAFVPPELSTWAYEDMPLPIGDRQTISQPYMVAWMTAALQLAPDDRVLEIGTGSGYAAAVLSCLAQTVYTVERLETWVRQACQCLRRLGYRNVCLRHADGALGWPARKHSRQGREPLPRRARRRGPCGRQRATRRMLQPQGALKQTYRN